MVSEIKKLNKQNNNKKTHIVLRPINSSLHSESKKKNFTIVNQF